MSTMPLNDSNIHRTVAWFEQAFPNPVEKNFNTQLGVHFEEIAEMLETLQGTSRLTQALFTQALVAMTALAAHLKTNGTAARIIDRENFLDGLCDQLVTASGVGYMAKMDIAGGFGEVNRSNFSKFDDNGRAILDNNLKLVKGPRYFKPNLKSFTGDSPAHPAAHDNVATQGEDPLKLKRGM
jgi:predicted HAD superfamily Cof-like phosphohydrolase